MNKIVAKNANQAFRKIMENLRDNSMESAPRGLKIKELINCNVVIQDPKDRMITFNERGFSSAYAFGELAWYMDARNDLKSMKYYSSFVEKCSDDGKTLNSAYGHRIFGLHKMLPFNQWLFVRDTLKNDPDSRQAVIHLHTPNNQKTKDEVCTMSLQFLIRDGKLDMITTMRSNDVIYGFAYDVFCFTAMQSLLAEQLFVKVGTYYHNAGSMHIYEDKFHLLDKIDSFNECDKSYRFSTHVSFTHILVKKEKEYREYLKAYKSKHIGAKDLVSTIENLPIEKGIYIESFIDAVFRLKLCQKLDQIIKSSQLTKYWLSDLVQYFWDIPGCEPLAQHLQIEFAEKVPAAERSNIIIEGPDRIGKSTMLGSLAENTNDNYIFKHYPKPTKRFIEKAMQLYRNDLNIESNMILDRSFLSEIVYSKALKRDSYLTKEMSDELISLLIKNDWQINILLPATKNADYWKRVEKEEGSEISSKAYEIVHEYYKLGLELEEKGVSVQFIYL